MADEITRVEARRFLVFAGTRFYPWGGWGDFKDSFDTEEEANAAVIKLKKEHSYDLDFWYEIIDTERR